MKVEVARQKEGCEMKGRLRDERRVENKSWTGLNNVERMDNN